MLTPFFTSPDKDLIAGDSARDPLGLMPIWSKVGHQLIPGLASIVSSINGIQGILFLYTCLSSLSPETRKRRVDDKILKFLERLWEFHLYNYRDRKPCFGINRLTASDFRLNFNGPGTVGTGLRQYYRGTCYNKKILAKDLKTLNHPWQSISEGLLDRGLVKWLEKHIKQIDSNEYSVSATTAYQQMKEDLVRFSEGNEHLFMELEKTLITDANQKCWIQHVVEDISNWSDNDCSPRDLTLSIQNYAQKNDHTEWVNQCQSILDCEPFLQVLESAYAILQESARTNLDKVSNGFAHSAPGNLREVCRRFAGIKMALPSKRLGHLQDLARKLENGDYRGFVTNLLDNYYPTICEERGKSPAVRLDGETVIAVSPNGNRADWSQSSQKWSNGYFIKTQIRLHTDLQSRIGGSDA